MKITDSVGPKLPNTVTDFTVRHCSTHQPLLKSPFPTPLSSDFCVVKMALIAAHLNAGVILVVTLSLYPHPFLPVPDKPYGLCGY